jgi:hypothetical protein
VAGDEPGRQDLDGDVASKLRVVGPIDLAHPTRAERGNYFIRTESGASCQGHARNRRDYTGLHGRSDYSSKTPLC